MLVQTEYLLSFNIKEHNICVNLPLKMDTASKTRKFYQLQSKNIIRISFLEKQT